MLGRIAVRAVAALVVSLPAILCPLPALAENPEDAPIAASIAPPAHASIAAEPFGAVAVSVFGGDISAKWNGVVADIRAERDILARCDDDAELCPKAARVFASMIAEGRARAGRARIGVINRAINLAIRPTSDLIQWGVPDRWSAPLATLTTGRGDCEDYAIAKYVALTEAGIDPDDVKLVILRDLAAAEDHAVVTVRLDGNWIVLDNRHLALVEDVDVRRVQPLFVLDHGGVKQFAPSAFADGGGTGTPAEGRAPAPGAVRF